MYQRIVMVNQQVLVPPSLKVFTAEFPAQTLQNLQVAMLLTVWLGEVSSRSNVCSQPKQAKCDLDV
jgi:hypothetical protein